MALASALVQVIIGAVRKTARPMLRDFGEVAQLQVSRKGPGDFVTAADLKAEDTLFELLMKARPGYGFLGEERGLVEGTDKSHTWIVDPIDGTKNYLRGVPVWATLIALEVDGEIAASVVQRPMLDVNVALVLTLRTMIQGGSYSSTNYITAAAGDTIHFIYTSDFAVAERKTNVILIVEKLD